MLSGSRCFVLLCKAPRGEIGAVITCKWLNLGLTEKKRKEKNRGKMNEACGLLEQQEGFLFFQRKLFIFLLLNVI